MVGDIVDVEDVFENGDEDVFEDDGDVEADDIVDDVTVKSGGKQLTYKSASTSEKENNSKIRATAKIFTVSFLSRLSYLVYEWCGKSKHCDVNVY